MAMQEPQFGQQTAKETVVAFIKALNKEDYRAARSYVNDDLSFVGVLGTRAGAEAYFQDMEKMKLKYTIKKVVAEGDDVCLFYNIQMGKATVVASGWYQLVNAKISSLRVLFDPRPLLDPSNNKQ